MKFYVTPRFFAIYLIVTGIVLLLAAGVLYFSQLMQAACS